MFATGWIIRRLNTEGVTDVTGTFLECFDIDRNLYILAEVVVFLWRVFIDIVSSAIGILDDWVVYVVIPALLTSMDITNSRC